MKEYGGYFELECFSGQEYHNSGVMRFNYCRTALQYLLLGKQIRKLYLPFYICESVIKAVKSIKVEMEFYSIDKDFIPLFAGTVNDDEMILIVNYYGLLTDAQVDALIRRYLHVIVDNTHAFFRRPPAKACAVYSCRKFFGVPDGGYLATEMDSSMLQRDRSQTRLDFLVGRLEGNASAYYSAYRVAEDQAEHEPIKEMSLFTQRILRGIQYDDVMRIREENYIRLHALLYEWNTIPVTCIPDGPFMYPLMLPSDARELCKYLHSQKIYVPTLWSNVLDLVDEETTEGQYVTRILPLPIDQRYTTEDMEEIAKIVKRGIKKCLRT